MILLDVSEGMLEEIAEIEKQCFSMPWTVSALRSQLSPEHIFLAAAASEDEDAPDGTVLGYVGMMHVLDEGYIANVAVAPPYRGRGIADAMLVELERRSRALRLSFMTLEVRAGNVPAINLYEKHGFRFAGYRRNYYEKPREDAIIMTRELKEPCVNTP